MLDIIAIVLFILLICSATQNYVNSQHINRCLDLGMAIQDCRQIIEGVK